MSPLSKLSARVSSLPRSVPVRTALLLLTVAIAGAATAAERASVAVLTIGNSFADDATALLPQLAEAGGKELVIFRANLGGATMERHAGHLQAYQADPDAAAGRPYQGRRDPRTGAKRDFGLPDALESYPWDFVTIQQVSHLSFRPETYHPFAEQLIAAIQEHAPQAEVMIHQTWAYREDHGAFQGNTTFTPRQMYEQSRAAYHLLAEQTGFRILPVGDAFHLARSTARWTFVPSPAGAFDHLQPGENPPEPTSLNVGWFWKREGEPGKLAFRYDGIHANAAGRYLGASIWYLTLYAAERVPGSFRPEGMNAADAAALRHVAETVILAQRALAELEAAPSVAGAAAR